MPTTNIVKLAKFPFDELHKSLRRILERPPLRVRSYSQYIWFAYLLVFITIVIIASNAFNIRRAIEINSMFLAYDVYSCGGLRWKLDPCYCSPLKIGFTPVMPIEFYRDFNVAIFDRIPSGDNNLNTEQIKQICDRNLRWLKSNAIPAKPAPVDVFYASDTEFNTKVFGAIKKPLPFVMKGISLKCFVNMKIDKLMETAGNNKVYMSPNSNEKCPDHTFVELKTIYKNYCYVANSTNLFAKYPDLLPDEDMDLIKDVIDGYMKNDSKQLFVGIEKGSGTALHAAYTNNFFLMIQGQKKWTFFNPNQLALIYPRFQEKGIYMASESRFLNAETDRLMFERFPLIQYAERYECVLEEGDILYNPASWFHSVYNITEVSVGCSTRWSTYPTTIPDTHMLRYGNLTNPVLRKYVKEIYTQTGILGISQIDEHKHMIGEKDVDALPFWDKHTNDSAKVCLKEDCSTHWHN